MGLLERIFGKREEEAKELHAEDVMEVPEAPPENAQTTIVLDKIDSYAACDRIIRKIKANHVVIAKIKGLKEQNMDELKHSISKIRTSVSMWNGDIAGVGDEWLIVTPSTAKIHRAGQ